MSIKKLEIEPITGIFYKSCYHHTLLNVVRYLGGSIEAFLANDVFINTEFESKPLRFTFKNHTYASDLELLSTMGIASIPVRDSQLTEQIIQAIDHDMPVLLPIYRYYWPEENNADLYLKKHYPNYLLIIGYILDKQRFLVLQSDYHDKSQKTEISFAAAQAACASFQKNIPKYYADVQTGLILQRENDCYTVFNKNKIEEHAKKTYLHFRKNIVEGFSAIQKSIVFYSAPTSACQHIFQFFDDFHLADPFRRIIPRVRTQAYQYDALFGGSTSYQEKINRIETVYNIIQSALIKLYTRKKENPAYIQTIRSYLDEILTISIECEQQYYQNMINI